MWQLCSLLSNCMGWSRHWCMKSLRNWWTLHSGIPHRVQWGDISILNTKDLCYNNNLLFLFSCFVDGWHFHCELNVHWRRFWADASGIPEPEASLVNNYIYRENKKSKEAESKELPYGAIYVYNGHIDCNGLIYHFSTPKISSITII